jgi:hypothetical protein
MKKTNLTLSSVGSVVDFSRPPLPGYPRSVKASCLKKNPTLTNLNKGTVTARSKNSKQTSSQMTPTATTSRVSMSNNTVYKLHKLSKDFKKQAKVNSIAL